jgi:NAD-dependent dihydropyrimidine dehydrogenase PreA subunit
MAKIIIAIDHNLCNRDGLCVENCPGRALAMKDNKVVIVDPKRCGECYLCESGCSTGAIRVYRGEE